MKFSKIKEPIEKIEIKYGMRFDCIPDDLFSNSPMLSNGFIIDCVDSKIVPKSNISNDEDIDCEIYQKALKNVKLHEIDLNHEKLDKFLSEFVNVEFKRYRVMGFPFHRSFVNFITVTYKTGETEARFFVSEGWLMLGRLLKELVGFDILNTDLFKYIVTNMHYEFKGDGIYERKSQEKLELKSLIFRHDLSERILMIIPNVKIDFKNKIFNHTKVDDNILDKILGLLEKYHIYELEDEKYWQKTINHGEFTVSGYYWTLHLVFDGGKHWMIGDYNEYPGIFVHLAEEIIELTGEDLLDVSYIDEEELECLKNTVIEY